MKTINPELRVNVGTAHKSSKIFMAFSEMIHKIQYYMNTSGIIYTFSFLMLLSVMFAFEFSEYDAFAHDGGLMK